MARHFQTWMPEKSVMFTATLRGTQQERDGLGTGKYKLSDKKFSRGAEGKPCCWSDGSTSSYFPQFKQIWHVTQSHSIRVKNRMLNECVTNVKCTFVFEEWVVYEWCRSRAIFPTRSLIRQSGLYGSHYASLKSSSNNNTAIPRQLQHTERSC